MITDELKNIVDQLNKQGKMFFLEGATEEQITDFENKNEVELPKKYKEWLLFSDGGECFLPAGIQLYGVAHKPLIDVNDNDRPNENYIVIGTLSFGDNSPVSTTTEIDSVPDTSIIPPENDSGKDERKSPEQHDVRKYYQTRNGKLVHVRGHVSPKDKEEEDE